MEQTTSLYGGTFILYICCAPQPLVDFGEIYSFRAL